MPRKKARAKRPAPPQDEEILEIRPDQKLCRLCGNSVPRELPTCPFCRHSPWIWHQNSRLLIVTLIICLFLFILFPLLTNREKTYRVPVTEEDAQP